MGDYRLKNFSKKAHTLEKIVFIVCLGVSIATFCAESDTENLAHPVQPGYSKEEIPTGVPPHRQNVDAEQAQSGIFLIDGPYYPKDTDEKLHTTCCCITH